MVKGCVSNAIVVYTKTTYILDRSEECEKVNVQIRLPTMDDWFAAVIYQYAHRRRDHHEQFITLFPGRDGGLSPGY